MSFFHLDVFQSKSFTRKSDVFQTFPHYFLRPYDAQLMVNNNEFLEKLSSRNCEWMCRPDFAISEASQAIIENWEIAKGSNFLSEEIEIELEKNIGQIHQSHEYKQKAQDMQCI